MTAHTGTIRARRGGKRPFGQQQVLNPGKGLNNFTSDSLIADQEASDLSNVMFSESGVVQKAYGTTLVGTGLTNTPKGLGSFIVTATGIRKLLTIDGTSLKQLINSAWTAISGVVFTTGKDIVFVQALGKMYIHNGTDAAARYDGTTLDQNGTTVTSAFGIFYKDHQICSGVTGQPNRIYISGADPGDFTNASDTSTTHPGATAFTGTDARFVDILKDDGDFITGFGKFQDQLIISKTRAIYSMVFDSTGTPIITVVTTNIGYVAHRSIDNVENDLFGLTRKGYYVLGNEPNYFNLIRTNELSSRIHPLIDTITPANLSRTASLFSDFTFFSSVSVGGTTTNNQCITYDRRYLGWSKVPMYRANAFTEFVDSNNVKHLYYAADDEAQVYEIVPGLYNFNGAAINAYWVSKAFDQGKPTLYKRYPWIDLIFRQLAGSVAVQILTDGNTVIKTTSIGSAAAAAGLGMGMLGTDIVGGSPANTETIANLVTNLVTNPSFETNTTGWAGTNATLSQISSDFFVGLNCLQAVITVNNGHADYATSGLSLTNNYTAQARVKATAGSIISINLTNVPGSTFSMTATGGWDLLTSITGLATSATGNIQIACTTTVTIKVDAVQLEASGASAYLDGAQTNTSGLNAASQPFTTTYAWTGTAHASTSTRTINTTIGTAPAANSTLAVATSTQNIPYRFKLHGAIARSIKVKISNNNINENFILLGVIPAFRPYGQRKFPSQLTIN